LEKHGRLAVNRYLKIALALGFLIVPALLLGQALPKWRGVLTGIADYDGSQFSSAKPFPVSILGSGGVPGTVTTKSSIWTPLGCPNWLPVTSGSAVLLSNVVGGIPTGATLVAIVPTVGIVLNDFGVAPTTTGPGVVIAAGMYFPSSVTPLSNIQIIAQSGSGFLATCFYR
jgi:hypothetical protein